MKKRYDRKLIGKILAAGVLGAGFLLSMAWPFFSFIVCAGKKKEESGSSNRKKWFSLKHTTINHPKHGYAEEYEKSGNWCRQQHMRQWYIKSEDGKRLHASFLEAEDPKRYVMLCHGYRGTAFGSVAHIAPFLHENGCSILFIDQRCCGESEGKYITFGAKEKQDILAWLRHLQMHNKNRLPIYLYGQSMGAASVILAAESDLPGEVHGLIADCGYHSMKQQLRDIARGWFHLPWIEFLILRVDLFCRIFAGFSMKETDTTAALRSNDRPVLFFHGQADTYVWPENTVKNYRLCRAEKELVLIPGARHLCCSFVKPQLYQEKISEFFSRYDR